MAFMPLGSRRNGCRLPIEPAPPESLPSAPLAPPRAPRSRSLELFPFGPGRLAWIPLARLRSRSFAVLGLVKSSSYRLAARVIVRRRRSTSWASSLARHPYLPHRRCALVATPPAWLPFGFGFSVACPCFSDGIPLPFASGLGIRPWVPGGGGFDRNPVGPRRPARPRRMRRWALGRGGGWSRRAALAAR